MRYLACIMIFAATITGCSSSQESIAEKNKDIVRAMIDSINDRNYDALEEYVSANIVRHSQATPGIVVESLEDFKDFLKQDLLVFPDAKQEIEMIFAEGIHVAVYMKLTATQQGAIGPYAATGRNVDVRFIGILRIEDDRIAEMWVEWDNLNILAQLGHFPPAAS